MPPLLQVLTLLAWCSTEAGEPERALSCLQALQQVGGPASSHFSSAYLSLRCLLLLGRCELKQLDASVVTSVSSLNELLAPLLDPVLPDRRHLTAAYTN